MADNITLNLGSGGPTIRTDDDGTAQWQYVKLAYGADNTQNIVTSTATNPLPVALSDTDNAVLDTMVTSLQLIDNAVSGTGYNISQMNGAAVPIGAGLEATAIRVTLATDSTGIVSIDDNGGSLTVDNGGTFAVQVDGSALTALQLIDDSIFADDAAFTTGSSKVTMSGAIRDDALSTLTAVEGDAVPLRVNSTGALHVTGGGGGTEYNEDAATPATITGTATMMERDDALSTLTPIEGDWASLRCNARGAMWVSIDNTSDITIADGGNSITIDNSTLSVVGGGVEATALRVTLASDSTGVLSVDDGGSTLSVDDGGGSLTVDGTVAVSGTVTVDLGANNDIQGIVAHDAVSSGNPVGIGAYATNSIEALTQVAAGDRTQLIADLNGALVTRPYTTPEEILSERVSDTSGTSTAFTTFGAGGAGVHNYITTFSVWNSSATDGYVDIRDGTAGSILFTLPAPQTGGSAFNLPIPLKQSTANTALAYDVSAALSTVYISAIGYQAQG